MKSITPTLWMMQLDEKKAAAERREALEHNARLEGEIAAARRAGDEERAKVLIDEQWRWRETADRCEAHLDELDELRGGMLIEAQQIEEELAKTELHARFASQAQRYTRALEEIADLRRDVTVAARGLRGSAREKEQPHD